MKNILLISGGSLFIISILLFVFGKNKVFFIEIKTNANLNTEIKLSSSLFRLPFISHITAKASQASFDLIHSLGRSVIAAKNYKNVNIISDEIVEQVDTYDLDQVIKKKKTKVKQPNPKQEEKEEIIDSEELIEIKEIF